MVQLFGKWDLWNKIIFNLIQFTTNSEKMFECQGVTVVYKSNHILPTIIGNSQAK